MEKIKIITDSACDIPFEDEKKYQNLKIFRIPITVDGKSCYEREDFGFEDFYRILNEAKEIPATSFVSHLQFAESYLEAVKEGYDSIIVVTINSKGSGMYNSANMAKDLFYEENPQYKNVQINVVDSLSYTIAYGHAVLTALEKIEAGAQTREILGYLEDYFSSVEIYFAPYTLKFAKKSGRINCAAAFVGEVLGLRPIISIIDGEMKIVEKVRGDQNVPAALIKWFTQRSKQEGQPYLLLNGESKEHGAAFQKLAVKQLGYSPVGMYQIGACISINAGPDVNAIVVMGEKRR